MNKYTLNISVDGNTISEFRTISGTLIAKGYERVVIGQRGPYIEFVRSSIYENQLYIPKGEQKRIGSPYFFYDEYRSKDDSYTKVYHQKRLVKYADYLVGMYYISPFDLIVDNVPCAVYNKEVEVYNILFRS